MPGKIKVKVLAGRNLPVMDRASDTTDAFVEIKFGSVTHKTDVCRKSLNPHWNSTEWYRFEVDESELQDEPLQLRLMDHDTYSANDAIGKVVISLAPLLAREANNAKSTTTPHGGAVMSGWIPVFDTMHGIRGELNVIVKVELFSDFNKYKTSSCGVQFFHCPMIPPGYRASAIHGFVEELVVNDDPEYQWIDKIRTPRASNEARQVAFIKLSNQVQRLVGLKAAELGANAVVGYQQDFDLEGEAGVVARAIGTAVSITPLPTPSQPLNMPPCTQQQLKKYLDILASDNDSITDLNIYYQNHQEELQKLLNILNPNASSLLDETDPMDEDENLMDLTRQSSITSYAGTASLYQDEYPHPRSLRHLSEDQIDLNKLLNKDVTSDDSDSSGPLQKIKKIRTSLFSKRFSNIRSKNKSDKQDDQISLRSNSSDTSRISLVDIKNELKKFKRLKKPKFRKTFANKEDEGEGMASILARSIIHVHTSLDCIAETQDSEHSPGSTLRRTSESEPMINVSDEEKAKISNEIETINETNENEKLPEIRCTSLNNINSEERKDEGTGRQRKISESCPATPVPLRNENLLDLPRDPAYFGSISSALSADSSELDSESSYDDDESSDVRTDTERSFETTSSVVQSVLSHEVNPAFIANMEKKLSVFDKASPIINEIQLQDFKQELDRKIEVEQQVFDNQLLIEKCKSLDSVPLEVDTKILKSKAVKSNEASTSSVPDDTCVKPSSLHIKFHNPFAHKKASNSISAPSSPVEKSSFVNRSSKRIRRQLSKLSKSNMIKSLSHYSLHSKKKDVKTPLSQPGSLTDVQSKAPGETVLGSAFLSYTDLMTLDKEGMGNKFFHKSDDLDHHKFSMYIGSEPVSRASLSGPSSPPREEYHEHSKKHSLKSTGLVHTAMETILLDKVQSLLIPTSPDPDSVKTKQFFDDVNEKLGEVEKYRNTIHDSLGNNVHPEAVPTPKTNSPPINNKPVIVSSIMKTNVNNEHNREKSPSLVQTAMETMLIDRVQSALVPATPDSPKPEIMFSETNNEVDKNTGSKKKNKKPLGLIQSLLGTKSESTSPTEKSKKKEVMSSGLVHTAMETILMEKVQSVLGPETPQPAISAFDDYDRPEKNHELKRREETSSSLVQTAMQTMLLDRVQASALGVRVPDAIVLPEDTHKSKEVAKTEESTGLTHTAMETILFDKVKSLVGQPEVVFVESNVFDDDDSKAEMKSIKDDVRPSGLVHMAMETMLLDKVQASALGAKVDPVILTEDKAVHLEPPKELNKTDASTGLTHTAMETILFDKVKSLVGEPEVVFVEPQILDDKESENQSKHSKDDVKPSGLVHMAMETMLLDKIQASALGAKVDPIITNENTHANSETHKCLAKTNELTGLTHTAMETILFDKVKSLVGEPEVVFVEQKVLDGEGSEKPERHIDDVKPSGLVHMAMETMLLDKVQASALGAKVDPIISTDNAHPLTESTGKLPKTGELTGLTHTAMETILFDKVKSLVGEPEVVFVDSKVIDEESSEKHKNHNKDDVKPSGLVHMAMETILLDKVQASALGTKVDPVISTEDTHAHPEPPKALSKSGELTGLTHTAMETILFDKVKSLVGEPEVVFVEPKILDDPHSKQHDKDNKDNVKPSGLVHMAMETMLLDKVQASALGANVDPIITTEDAHVQSNNQGVPTGLTHTAMETILMDKVHSLVGQPDITFVEPKHFTDEELEKCENYNDDLKSPGLVQTVQTKLFDKVQSLIDHNDISIRDIVPTNKTSSNENLKPTGLVHTAFETMLLDKVQSLVPTDSGVECKNLDENNASNNVESKEKSSSAVENKSEIHKIQLPGSTTNAKVNKKENSSTKVVMKSKSVPDSRKKLIRQDSVESLTEETPKLSKRANTSLSVTKPLSSHPILGTLETIPSLPEGSIEIDVDANNSVCRNSHAVCGVNRSERERDRREEKCDKDRGSPRHARHESYGGRDPVQTAHTQNSSLNASSTPMGIHRRSSDSDLSVTPKGSSLNTSTVNVGSGGGAILRPSMNSNNLDLLEYPFLTMTEYPPGFIVHIGGTVCARSVKLADGGEGAARAAWWAELRTELRAHARALRCNAVIAYTDTAAICEDVCVLSASGTAAVINLDCDFNADTEVSNTGNSGSKNAIDEIETESCSMAHVPYSPGAGPYRAELSICGGCRRARVPTVLLATCAKPNKLTSHAKAITLTAVAARVRRAPPTSEPGARDISDQLPFLEYELHKLLLAKLRMQGANALFSLQTQIAIGERCVMALASGTAVRLAALPPPTPPRIKASENDKDALEIQKALWDSFTHNRAMNGYDIGGTEHSSTGVLPEAEEEAPALDLCADKDACVLELDEAEDVETARALATRHVNMQVLTNSHKPVIGAPPHAFAQVWRGRLALSGGAASSAGEKHVRRALDGVTYKLRRLQPCAWLAPKFQLELPEDEIQLIVSGAAIPLQDPNCPEPPENGRQNHHGNGTGDADDDIFALDEEQLVKPEVVDDKTSSTGIVPHTVSLTSLGHVSGARAARRVCALRLLFVRETTAVRELGGLSGFLHTFTCEVMAIVRAYTAALGGNALTSFYITQLMLQDNAHKNQGQCLLSVGGDVVHITY